MDTNPIAAQPDRPPTSDTLDRLVALKFDPVMYKDCSAYRLEFGNKIIYYITQIIKANSNITINQVCGLLRTTLQVPEELTRTTITCLVNAESGSRIIKSYESSRGVHNLNLISGYEQTLGVLEQKYPPLLEYEAPIYRRKKKGIMTA